MLSSTWKDGITNPFRPRPDAGSMGPVAGPTTLLRPGAPDVDQHVIVVISRRLPRLA